jgi:hypothetical protein
VVRLLRSFPALKIQSSGFSTALLNTYISAKGRGQNGRLENRPEVWYNAVHIAGTKQAFGSGGDAACSLAPRRKALWTCLCRGIPGGVSGFQLPITRRRGRQSVQGRTMEYSCRWHRGEHARASEGLVKRRPHAIEKPRICGECKWLPQLAPAQTGTLLLTADTVGQDDSLGYL